MIITIENLLPPADLQRIMDIVPSVAFEDGRGTAVGIASKAKHNLQAKIDDPGLIEINRIARQALLNNEYFATYAMPLRMTSLALSRYDAGMGYGDHVDRPVMQGNPPVRTDLAMTMFLSPPESCDGGELTISSDMGAQSIKLAAGSLVLYPANTTHRVEKLTRGQRLALVGWVQSSVRNVDKRLLLAELAGVQGWALGVDSSAPAAAKLVKIRGALVRMWAET